MNRGFSRVMQRTSANAKPAYSPCPLCDSLSGISRYHKPRCLKIADEDERCLCELYVPFRKYWKLRRSSHLMGVLVSHLARKYSGPGSKDHLQNSATIVCWAYTSCRQSYRRICATAFPYPYIPRQRKPPGSNCTPLGPLKSQCPNTGISSEAISRPQPIK